MSIQIENGFRYPLSRFPTLVPTLHDTLVPLGDREAIRIASELTAIAEASPESPWETLKMYAPRFFKPPVAVTASTSAQSAAIDLVYAWSEHGLHRNTEWSMYDASIRVDMWTLNADDADAQYVYGRIVATSPGMLEALISADGFEDYSYWDDEDASGEWEARLPVWERINDKSLFGWTYRPGRIPMMAGMRKR